MTRIRPALLLALTLSLALFAPAAGALDPDEMFADPAQEARARDIGRQLRCLVCQNQSIFDSNAGLARDLRVVVRERMTAGDDDDQVLAYVADRFGEYVLLKPRLSTETAILWATPVIALLLGFGFAASYLRRRAPQSPGALLDAADRAEAKKLLQGEGK